MKVALKIRGIYTIALTKFFADKGLTIVSPSEEILKGFGSSRTIDSLRPMDLAIGDLEGGQGILLEGRPEALNQVIRLIREAFVDAICRRIDGGEQHAIAEVEIPYLAKSALDGLRGSVVSTLFNHHRLRIIASEYVDLIETKELAYHPEKREGVSLHLEKRLIWDTYKAGKEMGIDHVK